MYKTIDLASYYAKVNNSECEIGFFGKEPLLSFDLIEKAVKYRKKNRYKVNYSINTNGILLDNKMLNYLFSNNINIVLSIDRLISEKQGAGRFFASQKRNIKVRTTINSKNIFMLKDIINDFARLGFMNITIGFDYTDREFVYLTDEMLFDYLMGGLLEYVKLKSKNLRFSIPLFDRIIDVRINKNRYRYSSEPFCRIGRNIFSVDIDGRIYPCWRFVGDRNMVIGDVSVGIIGEVEYKVELKRDLQTDVVPFDFICYWAYRKHRVWFANNIRLLKIIKRASLNIER